MAAKSSEGTLIERRHWIYRHPVAIRVTHWINVVCLTALLMSGLQIFNAHPALYWGKQSTFDAPFLELKSVSDDEKNGGQAQAEPPPKAKQQANGKQQPSGKQQPKGEQQTKGGQSASGDQSDDSESADDEGENDDAKPSKGVMTIAGHEFNTTGWLGFTSGPDGELTDRGFPSWITLPGAQDLATARRWHFFFAWALVFNGLVYLLYGLVSGHIRHDLWARRGEWRKIGPSILEHIRLHFPEGDEARHYNILQKLTYLVVIFIMLPVLILAGMTMSPGLDAAFPWLLSVFGGRQSARTIHFILAWGLVLFVVVHVAMVMLSGFANNIRSMITGRYDIERSREKVG